MTEPVTKKIDTLSDLSGIAASDDKMVVIDASDTNPVTQTKLVAMNQISIHTASQLATDVVENSQIKDGAVTAEKIAAATITADQLANKTVTAAKIADNTITGGKLVNGTITATQIANNTITATQIADNAVTESKLGTIKRTVMFRITGPLDEVEVLNFGNFVPWSVSLNGFVVVDARINLKTPGTSTTTVILSNQGGTMATLSLASGATGMSATGTIASSYRTASTNSFLAVNVSAAGTNAAGLTVTLVLEGNPA